MLATSNDEAHRGKVAQFYRLIAADIMARCNEAPDLTSLDLLSVLSKMVGATLAALPDNIRRDAIKQLVDSNILIGLTLNGIDPTDISRRIGTKQ